MGFGDGGELELWDGSPPLGTCVKRIQPMFNRLVVFQADKQSFHGHTEEWQPTDRTRRSFAPSYYTSELEAGQTDDARTDLQSVVRKDLPISAP